MGRQKIELNWDVVDTALYYGATIDQLRWLLKQKDIIVSRSTLERAIKEKKELTFTEYREEQKAGVQYKLIQKAIQMALSGDRTMLIFCLKNLCNWSDKTEVIPSDGSKMEISLAYKRNRPEEKAS